MAWLDEANQKMDKCVESLKESLGTLRAGRVTAQLLDKVYIKAYGENMVLKSLGSISSVSATDLQVKIFDPSVMKDVIAGLNKADLGCTVSQNGNARTAARILRNRPRSTARMERSLSAMSVRI